MSAAIDRALQRIEALRSHLLQSVEHVRGFNSEMNRMQKVDAITRAYDEVIRILREERNKQ